MAFITYNKTRLKDTDESTFMINILDGIQKATTYSRLLNWAQSQKRKLKRM